MKKSSESCLPPSPKSQVFWRRVMECFLGKSHLPRKGVLSELVMAQISRTIQTASAPGSSYRTAKLQCPGRYFCSADSHPTPAKAGFVLSVLGKGERKGKPGEPGGSPCIPLSPRTAPQGMPGGKPSHVGRPFRFWLGHPGIKLLLFPARLFPLLTLQLCLLICQHSGVLL